MPSTEDVQFGRLALAHHFVTRDELTKALQEQERRRLEEGVAPLLGEVLIAMGLVTQNQVDQLLAEQSGRHGGKKLGGYELLERIGAGGMGAVYKARQSSLNRVVALKVLPQRLARDKDFIARFYREARAVAKFNHPNIVSGFEVAEADGYHFLAMEFVDGQSTADQLASNPAGVPVDEVLRMAVQIAEALEHAHEQSIIHRDIKPENILIAKDNTAKLCDLGLARSSDKEEDVSLTQAGMAVGTPHYISPEQARGRQDLDPRADIYSFGATIFHLVTGRPAFTGDNPLQIMTKHLEDPPPLAAELSPQVSAELSAVIDKMLAKQRDDRYQSMSQVLEDLRLVAEGAAPVHAEIHRHARPRPAAPRSKRRPPTRKINTHVMRAASARKRHPQQVAAVLLVLVFILAGGGIYYVSTRNRKPQASNAVGPSGPDLPVLPTTTPAEIREARNRARFERAESWAEKHKGDLRRQIDRFETVAKSATLKSPWGQKAARRAAGLRNELDEAIRQAFKPLGSQADKLLKSHRYGKAVALFQNLPADFQYAHEPKSLELAKAEVERCEAAGLASFDVLLAKSKALLETKDYAGARKAIRPAAKFGLPDVNARLAEHLASIDAKKSAARVIATAGLRAMLKKFVPRLRKLIARREYSAAEKHHADTLRSMKAVIPKLPPDVDTAMTQEREDLSVSKSVFESLLNKFRKAKVGASFTVYSTIEKRMMKGAFLKWSEQTCTVTLSRNRGKTWLPFPLKNLPCSDLLYAAGLRWDVSKPEDVKRVVVFVCRDGMATPEDLKIVRMLSKTRKFDASRYLGSLPSSKEDK